MATGFIQLNENDTKELRKEIGLSVTTSEDYSISNVNNKDELVEVGDLDEGWLGKLLSKFGKLESEFGLMEHSFSIMANAGKDSYRSVPQSLCYGYFLPRYQLFRDKRYPQAATWLP